MASHRIVAATTIITIALGLLTSVASKIYDRCELARELRDVHEIPTAQIATWVCLARHESEYNTAAINHGSGDHGIFQISQLFWCSPPGYACGVSCNDLHDDDIEDDVICARRIYREHKRLSGDGFNAWVVYHQHCNNKQYAEKLIEGCFVDSPTNKVRNATNFPEPVYFPQFTSRVKPVTKPTQTTPITRTQPPKTTFRIVPTTQPKTTVTSYQQKTALNTQAPISTYQPKPTQAKTTFGTPKTTSSSYQANPAKTTFSSNQPKTQRITYNTRKTDQPKTTFGTSSYQPKLTYSTEKSVYRTAHQHELNSAKGTTRPLHKSTDVKAKQYTFANEAKTIKEKTKDTTKSYAYTINKTGFRLEKN